jgi:hypothetical protein
MSKAPPGQQITTIMIDKELLRLVKIHCVNNDTNVSEFIRYLLRKELLKEGT